MRCNDKNTWFILEGSFEVFVTI